MHRIDSNGAENGKWQPGDPVAGKPATMLPADWFNDIQENVARAIEAAGLALQKGNPLQLRDAIVARVLALIATAGGSVQGGGVPTSRSITGAGLATGGGSMAVNRVITVAKATPAQVALAEADDLAVTPLGLAGLVGATLTTVQVGGGPKVQAVIKLGKIIIQSFHVSLINGNTVVPYPESFPHAAIGCLINSQSAQADILTPPVVAFAQTLSPTAALVNVNFALAQGNNATHNLLVIGW